MYKIFIYCSLLIVCSEKILRTFDDEEILLYYCFPFKFPKKSSNNNDIEIFCSKDECFGRLYLNKTNIVSNLIILCNEISCKIEKNNNDEYKQGILNSNEEFENFNKIILTCFKDNCIGGPIKNDQNKTNNKNDEDLINSNININNYKNINDENNKQNLKKDFLNETIILLNVLIIFAIKIK